MPRLYGRRWNVARLNHLDLNPWCVICMALGRLTKATVVDHKIPHRGDETLFWDETNWQSMCKPHHDSTKQAIEKGSTVTLVGVDGYPVLTLEPGRGGIDAGALRQETGASQLFSHGQQKNA